VLANLRLAQIEPTPDVFAVVMATGIVSIGAHDHHYPGVSDTLVVLAALSLGVLATAMVVIARQRRKPFWEFNDPDVTLRLFTFVAACAVLGTRVSGNLAALRVLGAVALSAWLVLAALTARNMAARAWTTLRDSARGAWELASVGTSGLVIVMSALCGDTGHRWWLLAAVPLWAAAIGVYALMTGLILWRAVAERQHNEGFAPDSWIMMGALAIATVAGEKLHEQVGGSAAGAVRTIIVITWTLATLWIPPLIYLGLRHINQQTDVLHVTGAWWSLVFPIGMYSVATDDMAVELGARCLQTISLVFFWDAFALWLIVVVAGLLRLPRAFATRSGRRAQPR